MSDSDVARVRGRSKRHTDDKPCSSMARVDVRPNAPAPPVTIAFPSTPNLDIALVCGSELEFDGSTAVSGLFAVDSVMVGITRDAKASLSSVEPIFLVMLLSYLKGSSRYLVRWVSINNFMNKCLCRNLEYGFNLHIMGEWVKV